MVIDGDEDWDWCRDVIGGSGWDWVSGRGGGGGLGKGRGWDLGWYGCQRGGQFRAQSWRQSGVPSHGGLSRVGIHGQSSLVL